MKTVFSRITDLRDKSRLNLLIALSLAILTAAVYSQVRHDHFINLDDNVYVTANAHVQEGITLKSVEWAFTTLHANFWQPVTWLSLMLDDQLFGLNPGGYHLINLLFHILNTLLLFFVFEKMTKRKWPSAFIAALFGIHPLHVESVAWIAERKDVLSTFFFMLTLWSYAIYTERQSVGRYCVIILFFALGLMSKPMLVTLPFLLLLLDVWPFYRFRLPGPDAADGKASVSPLYLIWEKIPLFVLSAASCVMAVYAQKQGGALPSLAVIPFSERIANAIISYAAYIGKMFYPVNLAVFYPYPTVFPWWKVAGACLLLGYISFFAVRKAKQHPYLIVGWLWYLGTLLPVIGLVQVGGYAMADRFTYIPLIGLFIMIAWGVPNLLTQWRSGRIWLAASAMITIAILSALTFKQITYWKNSITLFKHALKTTSNNFVAYNNLGVALKDRGEINDAITKFLSAIRIDPGSADAHNNLGNALQEQGHIQKAIREYHEAIGIRPGWADPYNNLGNALQKQGHIREAIREYRDAIRIKPDYVNAYNNLGVALQEQGHINTAIREFNHAIRIKPDHGRSYNNLGNALQAQGHTQEAIREYRRAIYMEPGWAPAYNNLGNALRAQGDIPEAIREYRRAIRIKPDYADAHYNLGNALMGQGHVNDAIREYRRAVYIKPDYADAYTNLGNALQMQGRLQESIREYRHAIHIKPDHADAYINLGSALMAQGNIREAIRKYLQAIKIRPGDVNARYNLGVAYFKKGDIGKSVACFRKALKLNPDDQNIQNTLKKVLALQKQNRQNDVAQPR